MNTKDLFGGAIVAPVKNTFLDARLECHSMYHGEPTTLTFFCSTSQFRQIPDTQEVFVDMNTQQSLISSY